MRQIESDAWLRGYAAGMADLTRARGVHPDAASWELTRETLDFEGIGWRALEFADADSADLWILKNGFDQYAFEAWLLFSP